MEVGTSPHRYGWFLRGHRPRPFGILRFPRKLHDLSSSSDGSPEVASRPVDFGHCHQNPCSHQRQLNVTRGFNPPLSNAPTLGREDSTLPRTCRLYHFNPHLNRFMKGGSESKVGCILHLKEEVLADKEDKI
jgi:hypothetical protein